MPELGPSGSRESIAEAAESAYAARVQMGTRLQCSAALSGAAAVMFEALWMRRLQVVVGSTGGATLAVLSAFFGGLALGGWLWSRLKITYPARAYARLELALAALGLLALLGLQLSTRFMPALIRGAHTPGTSLLALLLAFVCCGPATCAMGATFPALVAASRASGTAAGSARIYGLQTLGATAGAAGLAFLLLPAWGVWGVGICAAGLNLGAAMLSRGQAGAGTAPVPSGVDPSRAIQAAFACTGFCGAAFELVALRILGVSAQDTVYTFALGLAAYVVGAALASAAIRWVPRRHAFALALGVAVAWLHVVGVAAGVVRALFNAEGGFLHFSLVETLGALLVVAPAAWPSTLTFLSLLGEPTLSQPRGIAVGAGWNAAGACVAALVGLLILPVWGARGLAALGILALVVGLGLVAPPAMALRRFAVASVVAAMALLPLRVGLFTFRVTPGWRLLWARDGLTAAVSVEESPDGLRRLRTHNAFSEGGDGANAAQARHGLIAAAMAPHAQQVLVLGLGSGGTVGGLAVGLPQATIRVVELVPEIKESLRFFGRAQKQIAAHPHLQIEVADARTATAAAARDGVVFDLVMGDLFHATLAGTGTLYTREHFETVLRLLSPTGVFVQWIALHEAPPAATATIIRTFYSVFPHGLALLGGFSVSTPTLGLIGTKAPLALDLRAISNWLRENKARLELASESDLPDLAQLAAGVIGPAATLRDFAGQGRLNTDNDPQVEMQAPRDRRPRTPLDNLQRIAAGWAAPGIAVKFETAEQEQRTKQLRIDSEGFLSRAR